MNIGSIILSTTYTDNADDIGSRVSVGNLAPCPQPKSAPVLVLIPTLDARELWPDDCYLFPARIVASVVEGVDIMETDAEYATRVSVEVTAARDAITAGTTKAAVFTDMANEIIMCNKHLPVW